MLMTEEEWKDHCNRTGCTMNYEEYKRKTLYVINNIKKR